MKQYTQPSIELIMFETVDVIRTSEGTSNDNNYGDIDWGF